MKNVALSATPPSFSDALKVWARIGLLSFGGPAAQISLMHREVVDERGWLTEKQYLDALGFCMLLPGPEAMQLATYAGWKLHGTIGGLAAGLLFIIPGTLVILALSIVYALFGNQPVTTALFLGVKAAVVIIVLEALLRISRRALRHRENWVVAGLAYIAISVFAVPFPLIVVCAALYGVAVTSAGHAPKADHDSTPSALSFSGTLQTIVIWGLIWWIPVLAAFGLSQSAVLPELGMFFSKLAVVTFGGAYAVLAYMAQDVVNSFGWLLPGEMMDGLGLAETTPGPLILVTEFVGFLAAYREGGMISGLLGAALTVWVTFAPCFLWIFAGAPYIDWIASRPRLKNALAMITSAVVGVILNLAIWFALHVFFKNVSRYEAGIFNFWLPEMASIDLLAVGISALCGIMLLGFHWGIVRVLLIAAVGALALAFFNF